MAVFGSGQNLGYMNVVTRDPERGFWYINGATRDLKQGLEYVGRVVHDLKQELGWMNVVPRNLNLHFRSATKGLPSFCVLRVAKSRVAGCRVQRTSSGCHQESG